MATTAQKVKLGIFLLVGGAVVLGMVAVFVGARLLATPDRYFVRTPDSVFGLEVGAAAHVRGVRVGRVAALHLHRDDFESVTIELELNEGVRVNQEAKAFLKLSGVTGLRVVDIEGGDPAEPPLESGSYITYERTTFDELQDASERLFAQAAEVMSSADRLMSGLAVIGEEVDWAELDTVLQRTSGLMARLEGAGAELETMMTETRRPLRETLERADQAFAGVERIGEEIEGVVGQLDNVMVELRGIVRVNADDLRTTMTNLREASQSLSQMSRELRRRPSRLLFGGAPEERR